MKLLHVVASYLPAVRYGGTIVSVHGLCRALAARGHDVHVYTTSVDGPTDSDVPIGVPVRIDGVNVSYFASPFMRRLYRSPGLGAALRQHVGEFAVVHTHAIYLWPLWAAAREARHAGVPYVMSPRGMLEKELIEQKSALWKAALIGLVEKRNLEGAAAIHVTSRREAEQAEAFGFWLRQMIEIPNGVDSETQAGAPDPDVQRMIDEGPFALFLGRINWKKGLDRLVASLPHAPGLRVILAGNDEEDYQPVIEALADRAGVRSRITFAGPVSGHSKSALLKAARLLVLPSYSENFGNVVLEAMASGCPVIVTPEVGVADLVRASGAGLVIEGSPEGLGGAMAAVASSDARAREMGEKGRAAAAAFTWDAVAQRMEQLYESVRQPASC